MFLEQITKEVSNRSSSEEAIKEAVCFVSNSRKKKVVRHRKIISEINLFHLKTKTKKPVKVKELDKNKKEEDSLEEDLLDELEDFQEEEEDLRFLYGLLEEQNGQLDYGKLFSYLERQSDPSEIYEDQEESDDSESWILSGEEAEGTIQKIQLSYLTGNKERISWQEKDKFRYWQEFNKALLIFYEQFNSIRTREVNYSL